MTAAFNLSQFANKVNTSGQADLTTAVTGTLAVANGGTGLSNPGTSGNVLQSNGSAWVSAAIGQYVGGKSQIFTSSGTFTIPSGISDVKVTVIGGGGNGGQGKGTSAGSGAQGYGGSGGAGAVAIGFLSGMTAGNTLSVTVGAIAGTSSVASGTQTITTIQCVGGTSGGNGTATASCVPAFGTAGAGGAATGATINIKGQNALRGLTASNGGYPGGIGGSTIYGTGGQSPSGPANNGVAGLGYGAGGSGGCALWNTTNAGGAGTAGIVIFEW